MIDSGTGALIVGGAKIFPIILSNGPPPAGTAPSGRNGLADIDLATRQADGFLYLIAVRRGGSTSQITFSGLPAGIGGGEVLFEYAQGKFREVAVASSAFHDRFGPHDSYVYRFPHKP